MKELLLEMMNITKEFPGVKALDQVNLKVEKGEIHAIVGENGAGKSTLMKVLSGVYRTGNYQGEIRINGKLQAYNNVKDSEAAGIAIIYQELALVKQMSIAENIFLGSERMKKGLIDWNKTVNEAKLVLKEVGLEDNPLTKIINLGVGKQQLVEIAKALAKNVEILILDEPTAALNEAESKNLLNLLRALKAKGVTCIYISHKLEEVKDIADTLTVIRDGKSIETRINDATLTEDLIISMMVGRKIENRFPKEKRPIGETIFELKNWNVYNPDLPDKKKVDCVNFEVKKGEILGIAGLMGAGRTELAMSIIGAYGIKKSGNMQLYGKEIIVKSPRDAIKNGICYLTEDRKGNGLVLKMSVSDNITLASMEQIIKNGLINTNEERKKTDEYINSLKIKTPSSEQKVNNLSGGNQQKVSLAKWLMAKPKLLILDEPTRGIDVGAKYEIYCIMNELAAQGVGIIMISSELPEIIGMSNRIIVLNNGKVACEVDQEEANQETIMYYATGGK